MDTMLDCAIRYANLGLAVFPLIPKDKRPLTKNGFKDATTDTKQIEQWWHQNPNANIGIATGAVSGGLFVIDCDVDEEKGKDGYHTFLDWVDDHYLYLQDTWQSITGRGGYHIMFKCDHHVSTRANWLPSVDVRADGGYIVAPPSIHPNGNRYEWEYAPDDCDLLTNDDGDVECIVGYINAESKKPLDTSGPVAEGGRNDYLYRLACSYQGKGQSDEFILNALLDANNSQCNPPLSEAEVRRIASSAASKPKGTTFEKKEITPDDLELTCFDDIEETVAEWLFYERIPKGELTIFGGDGGTFKTYAAINIAAGVTTGKPCIFDCDSDVPEGLDVAEPGTVLFFSDEDDASKVLKRRFRKVGADMKRIFTLAMDDPKYEGLKFNGELIIKLIEKYKPALCVFDPLQSFIGEKVDMSSRNQMRGMLRPLIKTAHKFGTTFLILMHGNKKTGVSGRQRLADSADIWDIARSVFMFGVADKETDVRYISHEKSNYSKLSKTILFTLEDECVKFAGESDMKDYDYVHQNMTYSRSAPKLEDATKFIIDTLKSAPDKMMSIKDIDDIAKAMGISGKTLRNAKQTLKADGKIKIYKTGYEKSWFAALSGGE